MSKPALNIINYIAMWHVQHGSWHPGLLQLCNNIHNETKKTVKAVLV